MSESFERELQQAEQKISQLQRQLQRNKNDFMDIAGLQVHKITSLKSENAKLIDKNALLEQKINDLTELYNSLLTQGVSAPVEYPSVETPYIRKQFYSPREFMGLISTIESRVQDLVPFEDRNMMLWGKNIWNKEQSTKEAAMKLLEKFFYKLVMGLSYADTAVGTMKMIHKDNFRDTPLVCTPQNRGSMESPLKVGDMISAIPNPELFGHRNIVYILPLKLKSEISSVYETEGVQHSEGNLSYQIKEYPLLRYEGEGNWSMLKKGKIEFLPTDGEVKIRY